MKTGELAAKAGCDVQTVRFYEREGLLAAPGRTASGYRSYDERHLVRLNFIRHCRSLDIPLPEVRQLLEFAAAPVQSCGMHSRRRISGLALLAPLSLLFAPAGAQAQPGRARRSR